MSFSLKVIKPTTFKRSTDQAINLPDSEKAGVATGEYTIAAWKLEEDHIKFTLAVSKLKGFNTWYAWGQDVEVYRLGDRIYPAKEVRLAVPFFAQTDNKFEPERTCNTSANAMASKFLGAKISGDDEYYQYVIKYGDTTSPDAQTAALKELGIKSQWRTDLDFDDLDKSLSAGLPIVIGILHRGTLDNPTGGGHILVVIGRTVDGDYIVHDPYGNVLDGYTSDVNNGKGAVYPKNVLKRRWTVEGANTGWGRTFYSN